MDSGGAPPQTRRAGAGSRIRFLVHALRERGWDHDRARRIAKMLRRERATLQAKAESLEGMAIQLAEIRALPEVAEPRQ